jgi:carbon storage regulator
MLVLTRRLGEEIVIGGGIRVTVLSTKNGRVRIGVTAPPSVSVDRSEVAERRRREGWFADDDPGAVVEEPILAVAARPACCVD